MHPENKFARSKGDCFIAMFQGIFSLH